MTAKTTVVGYIDSYGKEQCWNWAMSLKQFYTGKVVIIATRISQETYDWLKSLGFEVYTHLPHGTAPVVTRFLYMWKLIEMGKIDSEWVIMSDVKDVVFQDDLENYFAYLYGCHIVGGPENVLYKDEPWGAENMQASFPYNWDAMKDREIINAGTFAAHLWEMRELCMLVWYMSLGCDRVHNPDQAALNIILNTELYRSRVFMASIDEHRYAIQIGTTFDPNKKLQQVTSLNGIAWDADGYVGNGVGHYCIVHQYDRNPELKALIDARYRNVR